MTLELSAFIGHDDDELIRRWAPNAMPNFLPLPDGRVPYPTGHSADVACAEIDRQAAWFRFKSQRDDAQDIANRLTNLAARVRGRI